MIIPTISYLTDIYFDFGALKLLPELLKKYKILRPLIITDKGLVKLGILKKLNCNYVGTSKSYKADREPNNHCNRYCVIPYLCI